MDTSEVVYLQWRVAMCDLHIFQKTDWGKLRFKRWNKKFIIAVQSWSNVVVFVTGSFLDVTVTGHWHHDFQFLRLAVLQFSERKNRFRMSQWQVIDIMTYNSYSLQYYSFRKGKIGFGFLKHEDGFLFSWTTLIHTRRYSLKVDSFPKWIFCVTNNR